MHAAAKREEKSLIFLSAALYKDAEDADAKPCCSRNDPPHTDTGERETLRERMQEIWFWQSVLDSRGKCADKIKCCCDHGASYGADKYIAVRISQYSFDQAKEDQNN